MSAVPMGFQFEFDPENSILVARIEGEVTDDVIRKAASAIREHMLRKKPRVYVVDCSGVTKFAMSSEFVRHLARSGPGLPDLTYRQFIVTPSTVGFGLARMYLMTGESRHPGATIARSLEEVFDTLGVKAPQFEPLE